MSDSDIWDYFRKCDSEDGTRRARCLFCEQTLSYASTSHNLRSHLARVHPDEVTLTVNARQRYPPRRNTSLVWQYFSKLKGSDCVAVCNICDRPCSYKSTISNLRMHLARLHKQEFSEMVKLARERLNGGEEIYVEFVDGNDDSNQSAASPDIWSFYEKETGGRARCVVCRATLPHRARELRSHLKEHHPKLAQDLGDQSEQEEDSNETYTEVVYLEDEAKKPSTPRPELRPSVRSQRLPCKKRRISTPSSGDDDEQVEKFGTYITCLLKKMPKEACIRLQMEIINLIMTTKLRAPEQETRDRISESGSLTAPVNQGYIVVQDKDVKTDPLNHEREKNQETTA